MYSILLSKIEYSFPLIRERLNKIINKKMKVVVLPWAFPTELDYNKLSYEYFKEDGNKYNKYINPLLEMGIEKENIKILNCYDTKNFKQFKDDIKNSDILLLPGGNPEMFFSKVVQETELLYEIKNYNGIIIGESAGACLQFKRYFITAKNNYYKYFAFYDGFGVLDNKEHIIKKMFKFCTWHSDIPLFTESKMLTIDRIKIYKWLSKINIPFYSVRGDSENIVAKIKEVLK